MAASKIEIGNRKLDAFSVKTENSVILLIRSEKGMLGCGYFSIDAANKLGDALAIVTGVKDFDDMLKSKIKSVSIKAKELGISEGMTGKEALELISH